MLQPPFIKNMLTDVTTSIHSILFRWVATLQFVIVQEGGEGKDVIVLGWLGNFLAILQEVGLLNVLQVQGWEVTFLVVLYDINSVKVCGSCI